MLVLFKCYNSIMSWFEITLYVTGIVISLCILVQAIMLIFPLFSDFHERIVNAIIRKAHKDIIKDYYFGSVRRKYLESVYQGVLKKKKSSKIGIFESLHLMNTVKKIAHANNVEPSVLFEAIEELNGRSIISLKEVAELLGKGFSRTLVVSKARRGYSSQQIIESDGMPIKWSDKLYDKEQPNFTNWNDF